MYTVARARGLGSQMDSPSPQQRQPLQTISAGSLRELRELAALDQPDDEGSRQLAALPIAEVQQAWEVASAQTAGLPERLRRFATKRETVELLAARRSGELEAAPADGANANNASRLSLPVADDGWGQLPVQAQLSASSSPYEVGNVEASRPQPALDPQRMLAVSAEMMQGMMESSMVLAEGEHYTVYRVENPDTGTAYALKKLKQHVLDASGDAMTFVEQVCRSHTYEHPNVATMYFHFDQSDPPEQALVTELLANGSLRDVLRADISAEPGPLSGQLTSQARVHFMRNIAAALQFLISREEAAAHKNICTGSIGVHHDMSCKLFDTGLHVACGNSDVVSADKRVYGADGYVCPAHAANPAEVPYSEAQQVYALGVVALSCFTSRESLELVAEISQQLEDGEPASTLCSGAHWTDESAHAALKLALACTSSEPADRPTMKGVVQQLRGLSLLANPAMLGVTTTAQAAASAAALDDEQIDGVPFLECVRCYGEAPEADGASCSGQSIGTHFMCNECAADVVKSACTSKTSGIGNQVRARHSVACLHLKLGRASLRFGSCAALLRQNDRSDEFAKTQD
eukprot:SAG31_NODE_227_length_19818_cov_6.503271_14_plen_577_part_00